MVSSCARSSGKHTEPPLNTSSTGQNKASWLTFDGGGTRLDTYFATVSGNVGIGTASPDHYHLPRGSSGYTTLTIEPTADQRHGVLELVGRNRTDGGGFGAIIWTHNLGGTYYNVARIDGRYDGANDAGFLQFSTTPTGKSIPVERMSITSSGNVGIGIPNPTTARLHVAGAIRASGDICTDLNNTICLSTVSGGGGLPSGISGQTLRHDGGAWIATSNLYNDGTHVGIGTDTPYPLLKLHVLGAAGVQGDLIATGITTTSGGLVIEKRTTDVSAVPENDARLWLRTDLPAPPTPPGDKFFLLSYSQYDGNLVGYAQTNLGYTGTDGLQAADKICLNEVNTNGFIGKPANKVYTGTEVYAFLCRDISCRNLLPSTTYIMGRLGSARGGMTFTTDATRSGPNDNFNWSTINGFDAIAQYWTSRWGLISWSTEPYLGGTCWGWTSNSSLQIGAPGWSNATNYSRWYCYACGANTCDVPHNLVCVVETN